MYINEYRFYHYDRCHVIKRYNDHSARNNVILRRGRSGRHRRRHSKWRHKPIYLSMAKLNEQFDMDVSGHDKRL
jgi:hypothetical protein